VLPGLPDPIIAIVASAMIFAPVCSWLALQRGRSWAAWFGFGVALGPIAVAILLIAPPGRCPSCGTRTRGWPRRCDACGLVFTSGPSEAAVGAPVTVGPEFVGLTHDRRSNQPGPASINSLDPESRPLGLAPRPRLAGSADERDRHSATALGHRAIPNEAPTPRPSSATPAVLGSGIFVGGSEPLQIGSRYFIARVGAEMQVLGPIHITPAEVAARIVLADVEATAVSDRLLIISREGGKSTLAFSAVTAQPGVDLQQQLLLPAVRAAQAR
jgi:hypothetical protein